MQREGYNEGRIVTMFRKSDNHGKQNRSTDFSLSGYLVKKWCTPTYDTRNGFQNYPWPVIRLGELYLNLAEAAAEAGELNIAKTHDCNLILAHQFLSGLLVVQTVGLARTSCI